jgi:hypothetical protein
MYQQMVREWLRTKLSLKQDSKIFKQEIEISRVQIGSMSFMWLLRVVIILFYAKRTLYIYHLHSKCTVERWDPKEPKLKFDLDTAGFTLLAIGIGITVISVG